jgi:hypothetical protein
MKNLRPGVAAEASKESRSRISQAMLEPDGIATVLAETRWLAGLLWANPSTPLDAVRGS